MAVQTVLVPEFEICFAEKYKEALPKFETKTDW